MAARERVLRHERARGSVVISAARRARRAARWRRSSLKAAGHYWSLTPRAARLGVTWDRPRPPGVLASGTLYRGRNRDWPAVLPRWKAVLSPRSDADHAAVPGPTSGG